MSTAALFSVARRQRAVVVLVAVIVLMVGVVLWGTLSGSLLPFALRRVGFDPASASAPFVATLVDVTGLIIYFTIAIALLMHWHH